MATCMHARGARTRARRLPQGRLRAAARPQGPRHPGRPIQVPWQGACPSVLGWWWGRARTSAHVGPGAPTCTCACMLAPAAQLMRTRAAVHAQEDLLGGNLLGAVGGWPGGEAGLKKFIAENAVRNVECGAQSGVRGWALPARDAVACTATASAHTCSAPHACAARKHWARSACAMQHPMPHAVHAALPSLAPRSPRRRRRACTPRHH